MVIREDALEPLASHGLRTTNGLSESDHVRRVLRTGEVARLTVADAEVVIDSLLVGQPARAILVAPVTFKRVPLGVIVLATASDFAPDAEKLLEQLRADLGLAINNALAHDRLERLAAVDPLTDAYNRRFGLSRLSEEFSRAVRAESPLAVLMLDLDHFKAVNDTYGHLVGDRVLRAVAKTCRRVIREGDVLIRYGGEEFLVLLPGAGAGDLTELGERIRRAVGETTVQEGDQRIAISVSVGGASYSDDVESASALIARADAALYEAKESGRNRLVVA
jgi:diguanylate cyclase (GGDEF)-like protein